MQPLPLDNNTPPISQCPTCEWYVYQAAINNGSEEEPDWGYVLVEVTPVSAGQGSLTLRRDIYHEGYPVAEVDDAQGTAKQHPHQEF